ncbi:hypothetical protein BU24DRAFT_474359 [Aaosphaeria arxii CBS 175.79]|uniref:CFEM domain-containing protein n=1 Tax=Aaosphaeria arxii CBS 175.79 TaxID=1450172 RepID=A0A6A5X7F2_9PLEO|nr:uncharacterized protein BU24DRAFT_474359 [Aaosphaeria arxii CBS 175.79]KAF2008945.1 hypothetical protein BU24DRAFT_474359 [Aaosphaeria arxii CBS 175.79]
MRLHVLGLFAFSSIASAQLTFNVTKAHETGNWDKYVCLTNKKFIERVPDCLKKCQSDAAKKDGCAEDDFACHCVNTQAFSDLVEPCAFPPELGGHGTCTTDELGPVRGIITDLCNFFNASLYSAYEDCPQPLSKDLTHSIIECEETVITY